MLSKQQVSQTGASGLLHSVCCLRRSAVCRVPAYIAVHLAAQLSWLVETTPQFPDRQQTSSEVHLAGVQVRRQCHLQTWLHHPPRTCLVA